MLCLAVTNIFSTNGKQVEMIFVLIKYYATTALTLNLQYSLCVCVCQDAGVSLQETMRYLESQCLEEIEAMLRGEIQGQELGDLFFDCVDAEIKFYQ